MKQDLKEGDQHTEDQVDIDHLDVSSLGQTSGDTDEQSSEDKE